MSGNKTGLLFTLTSFGESHGPAIGGVIDGCPSGLEIDYDFIRSEMQRRKPNISPASTKRIEDDEVEFLSGIFDGKATGTSIGFILRSKNQDSSEYEAIKEIYRPSHADYVYQQKYGIRDYRGGGRSSARETAVRVAAGAVAKLFLKKHGIDIYAWTSQIGTCTVNKSYSSEYRSESEKSVLRCPDKEKETEMLKILKSAAEEGDSLGGSVSAVITGMPVGLGEPVFDKLQAELAKAMMSINAAKGFEYGDGFAAAAMKGSEHNDFFVMKDEKITTITNHSGGIQGGISNGSNITFRVAFKPVPSISKPQNTLDLQQREVKIELLGRHDVCVVPRAVSVVEAMSALVISDHLLRFNAYRF
jgi:chorismate synthase